MSIGVLRLITATGILFALAAIAGFLTNFYILGIPNLAYEFLGVGVLGFICGYEKYSIAIWLALLATIIAIILDPAIWNMYGLSASFDM